MRRVRGALIGMASLIFVFAPGVAQAFTQQEINCSCVIYVRSVTGLPGGPSTAAGYTHSFMSSIGWVETQPKAGAVLVWDANAKEANDAGHIAIIKSATHDASGWHITVRHSNWGKPCQAPFNKQFDWPDLNGLHAYIRQLTLDAASTGTATRDVTKGGDVVVSASGNWCSGGIKNDGSPSCGGPGGIRPPNPGESGDLLVPSAKIGVLVGRIGTGSWFAIGSSKHFTASAKGTLTVAMNDRACCFGDNSGDVTVTVRAWP